MGGGSKQSNRQQTTNNNMMASDNAVVLGEGASNVRTDVGIGATVLGDNASQIDGNQGVIYGDRSAVNNGIQQGVGSEYTVNQTSMDNNQGQIIGDGSSVNYGVTVGEGSSYVNHALDERTQEIIDQALQLTYENTNKVLDNFSPGQLSAAPAFLSGSTVSGGGISKPTTPGAKQKTIFTKANLGLGLGGLILVGMVVKGRKKR